MSRRVLFVIRGKLGDTLIAYATVRCYADAFPSDDIWLLTRSNYARLFAKETGMRVIGFSNRIDMLLLLLRLRFTRAFDALLVLWGFGKPIRLIGRLVKARRKIYVDDRYSDLYPEYGDLSPERLQSEPMWRVAQIFEPSLRQPHSLNVPSLAAIRCRPASDIGIAPLADEPRRIMSPQTLSKLLSAIFARHPGAPVKVFINSTDRGASELIAAGLPKNAEFSFFPALSDLLSGFSMLAHLYSTDTGLYHLAASMGIRATVIYGPTQPWKNMMPAQDGSIGIRLSVLGAAHCEEKSCMSPVCIDAAVSAFSGMNSAPLLEGTPAGCPLRAHKIERLSELSQRENTRHQA